MPNPETTVAICAILLIAATTAYTIYDTWRKDINERRQERLEQRSHWELIDRCERYSMRGAVDVFIAETLANAA